MVVLHIVILVYQRVVGDRYHTLFIGDLRSMFVAYPCQFDAPELSGIDIPSLDAAGKVLHAADALMDSAEDTIAVVPKAHLTSLDRKST